MEIDQIAGIINRRYFFELHPGWGGDFGLDTGAIHTLSKTPPLKGKNAGFLGGVAGVILVKINYYDNANSG